MGGVTGAGTAARLGLTGLKATLTSGVISGSTCGAISGAYNYTTSPGPHTIQGLLGAIATGAATGTLLGGASAAAGHGLATLGGKLLSHTGDELTTLATVTTGGLSDDLARLANQHVTGSGDTVLGRFPGYIAKANSRGASYFDIGSEWDVLVGRGQDPWALNQHFLGIR